MRTETVIKHYQTQQKAAEALGITQASVAGWSDFPPDKRQLQIERLTSGELKAEPGCRERLLGLDATTQAA